MKVAWKWVRSRIGWLLMLMASTVLAFTAGWYAAPTCFFTERRVADLSRFLVCYNARPTTAELYSQTMELCTTWGFEKVVTKPKPVGIPQAVANR